MKESFLASCQCHSIEKEEFLVKCLCSLSSVSWIWQNVRMSIVQIDSK